MTHLQAFGHFACAVWGFRALGFRLPCTRVRVSVQGLLWLLFLHPVVHYVGGIKDVGFSGSRAA